ncbi:MAG TPA: YncE family protein [bacterium]|nr:YncE family protein [bacterium]
MALIGLMTLALVFPVYAAVPLPLRILPDVPLPGPANRFDYASLDETRGRLYIAHLGAGTVVVFDTKTLRAATEIPHLADVHGVLAIPALGRVYATVTGTSEVVAIDEATNRVRARMPGGVYPDGLAYDPVTRRVFVSDEAGGTVTVIDVDANRVVQTIALGGEAGNTQYDPVSRRVFVAVQTRNDIAEIEPRSGRIVARYGLPGCRHDHGLAIDGPRRVMFTACDENAVLLALDLDTKRVVGTETVGPDPDVLAIDPGLGLLYVAAESGIVTMFAERGKHLRKVGELTAPHAHVVAVDPTTHRVFLPLENVNGHAMLRIAIPTP